MLFVFLRLLTVIWLLLQDNSLNRNKAYRRLMGGVWKLSCQALDGFYCGGWGTL